MPSGRIGRWAAFERFWLIFLYSGAAGAAPGAISGTVVPIFGTLFGAAAGCAVGFAVSAAVAPLLFRRDLGRAFRLMVIWSMVFAGVTVLLAWLCLYVGFDRYLGEFYMYGAVPGTVVVYLGGAVWSHFHHPIAWPKVEGGGCCRCGYSLADLPTWICPECGTDNEPKRLAQRG